jgi:formylglycine-generating enzyme required for sulfatase activity
MAMNEDWIIEAATAGESKYFTAESLPIFIGADPRSDIRLRDVEGSLQLGVLEGAFFVQPGRDSRNVRIGGELLRGSRRLHGDETIALDSARLRCSLDAGRLTIAIEGHVTGEDTAPPDLDELARDDDSVDAIAIKPIAFRRDAESASTTVPGRSRSGTLAVAAAFGILGILGWFAFTAKSVEIAVTPPPEELNLPETLFKFRLTDRFLLRSGDHRVLATLPGYYPLDAVIAVGSAPDQSVELTLEKLPGLVDLTVEPQVGARVRLDGEPLGATPMADVEIRPGRHRLEFVAERYLTEVRELDVVGGGERQSVNVVLTPSWAPVSFSSNPAGAEVLIDGMPLGVTPVELELSAGEREVEFRLAGYNAWRDTVVVYADQPETVPSVQLTQADGRVELTTNPEGAAVSVNGQFQGQTPLTLRLNPGREHSINVTKPGFEPVTQVLSVAADSGRRVSVDLVAQFGVVDISSEPSGAEIWVDGENAGATPQQLTLSALPHRIELRREGYASASTQLTPRPGFQQAWSAALEQLDPLTGSGYSATIETSVGQQLRLVLPGEFTMGSSRREQGRRTNEVLRAVRLSQAFYLGITEVSNAQFRAFKADHDSGSFSGISLNEDDQPAVQLSWDEVTQYLNWLSIQDGLQPVYEQANGAWNPVRPLRSGYRLPTEAEWAWAARFAGREEPLVYPWGAELPPPDRFGNFADVSAAELLPTTLVTYNDGFRVAAPVGSFAPNAVGILDFGGNVAEWVQDYYEIGRSVSDMVAVDPLGPESGRFHVIRGSSWRSATVTDLRIAARNYSADPREDVGFRIARNLE